MTWSFTFPLFQKELKKKSFIFIIKKTAMYNEKWHPSPHFWEDNREMRGQP